MYQVAICDDDLQCAEEMKKLINHISEDYKVDVFLSGKDFLDRNAKVQYDIVILDIEMPEITGLEVAGRLQSALENQILIFASSHECYAIEAIKHHPFRYIRKHCLQEDLEEALESTEKQLQQLRVRCIVQVGTKCEEFKLHNMMYAEVKNHNVNIHMQDSRGDLNLRMTMDELVSQMNADSFVVRTHKSYIVNLNHVQNVTEKEVILDNGIRVPLSRGFRGEFQKKYMDFVRN